MQDKFKMIQVDKECHEMAKIVAKSKGLLLREYIKQKVLKDYKKLDLKS